VWFSQTIGPGRGLETFVESWAALPQPPELRLLGQISDSFRAALLGRIPADRQPALRFDAPLPPAALPAYLAAADVGLALEPREPPSRDLTTTNKIYYYLGAGLAVIATPTAGQREVFAAAPGIGWLDDYCNRAAATARLDRICADRDGLRRAQTASRAAAEHTFSWEKESARLLELVRTALAR